MVVLRMPNYFYSFYVEAPFGPNIITDVVFSLMVVVLLEFDKRPDKKTILMTLLKAVVCFAASQLCNAVYFALTGLTSGFTLVGGTASTIVCFLVNVKKDGRILLRNFVLSFSFFFGKSAYSRRYDVHKRLVQ